MESNLESVDNHDGEGERPRLSIFLFLSEYSAFQPQYKILTYDEMHSAYNHCLFNLMKLPLTLSTLRTMYQLLTFVNLNNFELSQHVMHILQTSPRNH